jgi:MYXO-CTERM domain-containing protein
MLGAALAVLLAPSIAEARSITLHNPRPDEVDGQWKLKFTINYGTTPHMAHIPTVFSFKHVTKYEWAYTEQSPKKPVFNRKPLHNQPEINIPVDIGFADASGKLFKITKMKVPIRRDADMGFESGEYTLTVREGGRTWGRPMRITFGGQNKPIDRRPIEFKAKPIPPKKAGGTKPPGSEGGGEDFDSTKGQDMGDVMVDESDVGSFDLPEDEPDGPPPEGPRQGGCGCRLEGQRGAPAGIGWLTFGLGAAFALARRRRR